MGNLVDHAKREFKFLGWDKKDAKDFGMQELICKNILELLEVFSNQGHSGSTAPCVIQVFTKLAAFKPIGPLTGKDEEWREVSGGVWQNIRCGNVFKEEDGQAYDIEGKIFQKPNGCCFTSRRSRINVTFPYTPKRKYVKVEQ